MPINNLELDTRCYIVYGIKFEIPRRYTMLEPLREGSYGTVCAAQDRVTNERLAIRKIENAVEHITLAKQVLRELRMLRHLQHENLIDVQSIFVPGSKEDFKHVYVFSDLMETDLASILESSQPLTDDHCSFFLYQILRGMKYVHSAEVIHRDLKPRSLLVNANCDLKIGDFALAQVGFPPGDVRSCPLPEMGSTWYRAPEVVCAAANVTAAIDIWSIACIFAEMLARRPLFPGCSRLHQLQVIVSVLGSPQIDELRKIPNNECRNFIHSLQRSAGRPFKELFKGAMPAALEILDMLLQFDPDKRCNVTEALQQYYLTQLYCPEDEPTRDPLDTCEFEFDRRKVSFEGIREELFMETMHYYPEKRRQYLWEQRMLGRQRHNIASYRLLEPGESQLSSEEEEVL